MATKTLNEKTKTDAKKAAVKGTNETVEMLLIASKAVPLQPRALRLPRPATFCFEPMSKARKKVDDAKTVEDAVEGRHQIDPNRVASYMAMMPDLELLRDTGNPYLAKVEFEPSDDRNEMVVDKTGKCKSTAHWMPFVSIGWAVYQILKDRGDFVPAAEIVTEAVKMSGVGFKKGSTKEPGSSAAYAALDALRDLRTYGLVVADKAKSEMKRTRFKLAEAADLKKIIDTASFPKAA